MDSRTSSSEGRLYTFDNKVVDQNYFSPLIVGTTACDCQAGVHASTVQRVQPPARQLQSVTTNPMKLLS